MKKIILHIGRHKSGTTSLQKTFSTNRKKFLSAGVFYPFQGVRDDAHHLIAEKLMSVTFNNSYILESDRLLSDFKSELNSCDENTILISSEAFQNCKPEIIKAYFKGFDLKIVFYIREQLSYLCSAYQQKVHATDYFGSIEDFESSFDADYYKFYLNWARVFSSENLFLRVFSRETLYKGDVIADFSHELLFKAFGIEINFDGIELDPLKNNISLTGDILNFKLRLNKFLNMEALSEPIIYIALGIISSKIKQKAELIDLKLSVKVKNKYEESNKKLLELVSLPGEYLAFSGDFPATVSKKFIGPILFRSILEEIIESCSTCRFLRPLLYWVCLREQGEQYVLSISDNIKADCVNHLYINKDGSSLKKVTDVVFIEQGNMVFDKEEFYLETDGFVLKLGENTYDVKLILS